MRIRAVHLPCMSPPRCSPPEGSADPGALGAARVVVSVVLVSDYFGGADAGWDDARATLRALAHQDFAEPVEYLLMERDGVEVPEDLLRILPGVQLQRSSADTSFAMKNDGARVATADLVVLLDLDCVPHPGWLRAFVEAMRRHPDALVVSGRTVHAGRSVTEKILGLLARGYLDPGKAGPTRYVANQNAGYRRAAYLAHPLPADTPPFACTLQSEEILRGRGVLRFEPAMLTVHEFTGWAMQRDLSTNSGYGTVLCRLRDPQVPYAWLTRFGTASIPLIVAGKIVDAWRTCLRCAPAYDVPGWALPYAFTLAVVARVMEAPGMLAAFRGKSLEGTDYR